MRLRGQELDRRREGEGGREGGEGWREGRGNTAVYIQEKNFI